MSMIPSHAISLWFEGDKICLSVPPSSNEPSHIISIPIDRCGIEQHRKCKRCAEILDEEEVGSVQPSQRGWLAILRLIKERFTTANERHTISKSSAPVQYTVEQWLKSNDITRLTKRKAKEDLTLEDLDI